MEFNIVCKLLTAGTCLRPYWLRSIHCCNIIWICYSLNTKNKDDLITWKLLINVTHIQAFHLSFAIPIDVNILLYQPCLGLTVWQVDKQFHIVYTSWQFIILYSTAVSGPWSDSEKSSTNIILHILATISVLSYYLRRSFPSGLSVFPFLLHVYSISSSRT